LALAAEGAAALVAALTAARLTVRLGSSVLVLASLGLLVVGATLMTLATTDPHPASPWLFAAAQIFFGFSGPLLNISLVTLRQTLTPPHLLGRVNATARVIIMTSLPLGSLAFGALAALVGLPATLVTISIGLAAVTGATARPLLRASPDRACSGR
jgi:MFS family permease